jgi:hypothetical protein
MTDIHFGPDNPRPCGKCTLCCKLFKLPELDKPAGKWCRHCVIGQGCEIHDRKPQPCRSFQCMWTVVEALDAKWRPDVAGFTMTSVEMNVYVDVDPDTPDAWRREPYYDQLKVWSRRNKEKYLTVLIRGPKHAIMVFPEADIDLGTPRPDAQINSGYEMTDGRLTPYARYAEEP